MKTAIKTQAAPTQNYLIDTILMENSHGILRGNPSGFETIVALKIAHSVAAGKPFFGHAVSNPGKALYVCGAGLEELRPDLKALQITEGLYGIDMHLCANTNIRFDHDEGKILAGLMNTIKSLKPKLVIFNSLERLFYKMNTNSSYELGLGIELLQDTCFLGKASTIIIHDFDDYMTGVLWSNRFRDCTDFVWEVKQDCDSMATALCCLKGNDGKHFTDIEMTARGITVGTADAGEAQTSFVLKPYEQPHLMY